MSWSKSAVKKIVSVIVVLGMLAPGLSYADVSSAVSYLQTKSANPWVSMALSAAGQTADVEYLSHAPGSAVTDYEAATLALVAAGKNPSTFPNEDFVAKIKSFYSAGQLGDASILNDDIFGLLALTAAGESTGDSVIAGVKTFILGNQNMDGGWGFMAGGGSDTNMTSAAIMALISAGVSTGDSAISNAKQYLKDSQNSDGGFPYDPKSPWGTDSDASSDAWVISAITKLGESSDSWNKGSNTPTSHLLSLQDASGYFKYQAGSSEDSFSPVTTAYAVIALSGKSFPVGVSLAPPPVSDQLSVSYQIEGSAGVICKGDAESPTPLELIKSVSTSCGFTYHIQETSYGSYLDRINADIASGATGWMYAVNAVLGQVGAADYTLHAGDYVLWHFGDSSWQPSAAQLALSANILPGGAQPVGGDTVSFSVDAGTDGAMLNFGNLSPGNSISREITLTNSGNVSLQFGSTVTGDTSFRDFVTIDTFSWRLFKEIISAHQNKKSTVTFSVPSAYAGAGAKTGMLIFWAAPL